MKENQDIWEHIPPQDSSRYWRKLNGLKKDMKEWYFQGVYVLTINGKYSTGAGYISLLGAQNKIRTVELIRNKISQPRHRFIIWLVVQGRLLTKDRLQRMNIPVDNTTCGLCDAQAVETQKHLFSECAYTKAITGEITQWSGMKFLEGDVKQVLRRIKRK